MVDDPNPIDERPAPEAVGEHDEFVKEPPAADPDRHRSEAQILSSFRHPGIVELISLDDGPSGATLRLARVGNAVDLLHKPPLSTHDLVEVFGRLCQTLDELHQAGFVHGNIGAEHVLVDSRNRPVLCGFGNAAAVRTEGRPDGLDPALDVIAVGRLLSREVERTHDHDADAESLDALRYIAELATAHDITGVEPATLAERIHGLAVTSPRTATSRGQEGRSGRNNSTHGLVARLRTQVHGSARALGGLAIGAAAVLVIIGLVVLWPSPTAVSDQSVNATSAPPTTIAATTEAMPDDVEPPGAAAGLVLATSRRCGGLIDVDGDGCDDSWSVNAGVITVGSNRYTLGEPGDLVTVGDWDCDGISTPALVRTSTGDVFAFAAWPTSGAALEVTSVATIDNPTGVAVTADGDCDLLVVEHGDGDASPIDVGEAR